MKLPSSGWTCGTLRWILGSFEVCSTWAYVWISLDRYLATMKPNWYRINGRKEKVKRPLFIATLSSFMLTSPMLFLFHKKIFKWHCLEEDMNNAYVCYWSTPELADLLHLYTVLLGFIGPVTLVFSLNTISGVSFLGRYLRKLRKANAESRRSKSKQTSPRDASIRESTEKSLAAASIERKITIIMFLLAICFLLFVGALGLFRIVFIVNSTSEYAQSVSPPYILYKHYELLDLAHNATTALNGIVNGLVFLIFPSMRAALKTGLKRILK